MKQHNYLNEFILVTRNAFLEPQLGTPKRRFILNLLLCKLYPVVSNVHVPCIGIL